MASPVRIAGAAVIAVLAALTSVGCGAPAGSVTSAASSRSTVTGAAPIVSAVEGPIPTFVPRDYVTLDPANAKRLIVRDTVTGVVTATVSAPPHMVFTAVFGTGTGRVFTVDMRQDLPTPAGGDALYLLRLRLGSGSLPGSVVPLPLVPLHAGHAVGPGLTAVALSPDGSKLAIAYTYRTYPPNPQPLILYSTATGAVLRTWTVKSGIISAADPMANGGSGQDDSAIAMRWTADGRGLAFAFHANAAPGKQGYGYDPNASIRLLDTTAPGSDLIGNSRLLNGPGPEFIPGNGVGIQCLAGNGWSLSADGQAVTCAARWSGPGGHFPAYLRSAGCASRSATRHQLYLGFWRQYWLPGGGGGGATIYGVCTAADIQLFWASPDGRMVLGTLSRSGDTAFGLFSGGRDFIPLAPPPAGIPLASIAW
jgi:hypothetical protein